MRMLNEKELNQVSGGVYYGYGDGYSMSEETRQKQWLLDEKKRLEDLADIRLRAGEAALKAAMRVQHAEMEIKAAQRAAMGIEA